MPEENFMWTIYAEGDTGKHVFEINQERFEAYLEENDEWFQNRWIEIGGPDWGNGGYESWKVAEYLGQLRRVARDALGLHSLEEEWDHGFGFYVTNDPLDQAFIEQATFHPELPLEE